MSTHLYILASFTLASHLSFAQSESASILQGNRLYKQEDFESSEGSYKKALLKAPEHPLANYNLGNAQFRSAKYGEASKSFENTIRHSTDLPMKERAYYNQGVAFSKEQKLQESIDSWKNALKLDPADNEARENLQKALLEQKKQQQQQQQKEDKKKEDKKEKKDQKNQDKTQPKPKDQQSRLTKRQVEQLLKALAQKEKEVQQKLQSKNSSPSQQEKDW